MQYIHRELERKFLEADRFFKAVLVIGARQVGKSTLLERMAEPERKRVSLDNPTIRALAQTDPELFLQRYAPPVLIGAQNWITPCAELEKEFFPQKEWILDAIDQKIMPLGISKPSHNFTQVEQIRREKAGV